MSGQIIALFGDEVGGDGVPVSVVLDSAKDECEEVMVIGYVKGSGTLYAASSFPEPHGAERALWMLERAKIWILSGCPAEQET